MTCSLIPTLGEEQAVFVLTAIPVTKVVQVIRKRTASKGIYCMKVDAQPAQTGGNRRMRAGRGKEVWTMRKRMSTWARLVEASMNGQKSMLEMGGLEPQTVTLQDTGRRDTKVKTCPSLDSVLSEVSKIV